MRSSDEAPAARRMRRPNLAWLFVGAAFTTLRQKHSCLPQRAFAVAVRTGAATKASEKANAYQALSVKSLRDLCRERGLATSGLKAELASRLAERDKALKEAEFVEVAEGKTSSSLTLGDRELTQAEKDFLEFSYRDLRKLCEERKLSTSGSQVELACRLAEYQKEQAAAKSSQQPRVARDGRTIDRIVEAVTNDQLDHETLAEIFNIALPQPGEVVSGVVTSIVEWGAFLELDETGWQALLHISEISDDFIENIEDYIYPGMRLQVLVLADRKERSDRISVSLRRLSLQRRVPVAAQSTLPADQQPLFFPPMPRSSVSSEEVTKLQVRVDALEAVLIQLGYGQALLEARGESKDSSGPMRLPSAPELETLIGDVKDPSQREQLPLSSAQKEKLKIDAILADLASSMDVDPDEFGLQLSLIHI